MGCDYYIVKEIEIDFKNSIFPLHIELERDSGYFNFSLDEDDPDYDEKEKEYIKDILKPYMKPIILYDEDGFISKKYENKYKKLIEEELELYNKNHYSKEWKDIRKITKREIRYERD